MTFLWSFMLFGLILIPLLLGIYLYLERRRQSLPSGWGGLGGQAHRSGFRRYVPPALILLSLVTLLLALARPQMEISLPRVEGTVILVVDVSGSMAAADADPSRLEAAKTAAREFILSQPDTIQIGVVSFSGSGFAVQEPTHDTGSLLGTINRLKPQTGTSLGQGIVVALNAIAINAGLPPKATPTPNADPGARQPGFADQNALAQLPDGPYPPAVIVLLSDGENNQSIDPLQAAQAAAERKVRIDALGFGTLEGIDLELNGFTIHTALDEAALQDLTAAAGGTYYNLANEADLTAVYTSLAPQWVIKTEQIEITSIFAGAGMLILIVSAGLSLLWFNRLL